MSQLCKELCKDLKLQLHSSQCNGKFTGYKMWRIAVPLTLNCTHHWSRVNLLTFQFLHHFSFLFIVTGLGANCEVDTVLGRQPVLHSEASREELPQTITQKPRQGVAPTLITNLEDNSNSKSE